MFLAFAGTANPPRKCGSLVRISRLRPEYPFLESKARCLFRQRKDAQVRGSVVDLCRTIVKIGRDIVGNFSVAIVKAHFLQSHCCVCVYARRLAQMDLRRAFAMCSGMVKIGIQFKKVILFPLPCSG